MPHDQRQGFDGPVGLALHLRSPSRRSWDATNYLGGVADVLEAKSRRRNLDHLAELAGVSLYVNDRQIREVQYTHEVSMSTSYTVRLWPLPGTTEPEPPKRDDYAPRVRVLAIDFANTKSDAQDPLTDYQTLLRWLLRGGAIANDEHELLSREADGKPSDARGVVAGARELRDALNATLRGRLSGAEERSALDQIWHWMVDCFAARSFVWGDGAYVMKWPPASDVSHALWPIAASVEHIFLTKGTRQRIRRCASEGCERVFLDNSRNHTRRWCSMNGCGNLAKVRRLRQRLRSSNQLTR